MPPATDRTTQKLKTVKDSCNSAPFGEKRASAMKHFYAAEAAHKAKNSIKTNYELDAARHALA